MVQSRPTGHKKITLESHHRQVVDGSTPACALNNGKQGLGLNHPPPAGGGIAGNLSSLCRLGLNDPPAPAGGIWLNIICVDITGFQPTVGVDNFSPSRQRRLNSAVANATRKYSPTVPWVEIHG